MTLCSYIFGMLVALLSYILYQKYANVYTSVIYKPLKRYDYIIVGAGTAGCVLAARLTEDPNNRVLLIEAGDHMGYFTKIPLTPTAAQQGPNDWSVRTKPQKYSSFGLRGQTQFIPRGKGLGGSGQINFLQHSFGLPGDFKRWSRLNFKWTDDDLRPYFIKSFGTAKSEFDSGHCSIDGYCPASKSPMKLKLIDEQDGLMATFRQASAILQRRYTIFRRATSTVNLGVRHSSFDAYLKPALERKNLHVLMKTQAVTIRFENTTAASLYILQNHRKLDNIFANKEIILSAGAIKTPQILMLSGIGPRDLLERFKINTIVENEHVGRNLHDHMNMPIYVSIKKPISITLAKVFTFGTAWDYFWYKDGLLSVPPVAGVEYQNTSALILFSMGTANERLLRDLSNYKHQVFRNTFPYHNNTHKEGFMFLATCTQPRSRGSVTLASSSISHQPVVDPNYLAQHDDIKCMIKAIRRAEQLVASKPLQDIGARIHWLRPERCLSLWRYSKDDQMGRNNKQIKSAKHIKSKPKSSKTKTKSPPDEYLECIIREVAVTGHHVGGTCAGGKVVDQELRVMSVSGLRIMDASVIPAPLTSYPNSVIVAMAERTADRIMNKNGVINYSEFYFIDNRLYIPIRSLLRLHLIN